MRTNSFHYTHNNWVWRYYIKNLWVTSATQGQTGFVRHYVILGRHVTHIKSVSCLWRSLINLSLKMVIQMVIWRRARRFLLRRLTNEQAEEWDGVRSKDGVGGEGSREGGGGRDWKGSEGGRRNLLPIPPSLMLQMSCRSFRWQFLWRWGRRR